MVADDPESFADLDGHCDPNDWCGTVAGIAGGINNAVNNAYYGIVATLKDPLTPVSAAIQFADNGVKAYETKGVSGVLSDLAAQGRFLKRLRNGAREAEAKKKRIATARDRL